MLRLVDPYQAVRAAWATHRLQKRARAWLERSRQQRAKSIVARAASVAGSSSAYTDETESVASTAKEEAALLASYDKFGRGVKADTPSEHGGGADPHGIVQRLQGAGITSAAVSGARQLTMRRADFETLVASGGLPTLPCPCPYP